MSAIELKSVTKRFGDFAALEDVSLTVAHGSITALLGPSGGGKSTALRVIAGLEEPDEGAVWIRGAEVTGLPARKRGVGFVFQHYAPFKHMTAFENIAFGLRLRKLAADEIERRVHVLLALVGLEGFHTRYPAQLSGGQRQRMALARALAVEPDVLLLDEPFGALDARIRGELRAHLLRLHDEIDVTTLIVTHDRDEAMEVAERIVLINHGRVVQEGTPRELYEHPVNEFAMRFLGPVTELGGRLVRPHDIHLTRDPEPGALPGIVERVVHLGFEVRVEVALEQGGSVAVQTTRAVADRLGLHPGQPMFVWAVGEGGVPVAPAALGLAG